MTPLLLLGIAVGLVLVMLGIIFLPLRRLPASREKFFYPSYGEAIAAFEEFDAIESTHVEPLCRSHIFHHGKKTPRCIVIFHGYTNCPEQFRELGERLFAKGYNVIIPRIPAHGYSDKMTKALAHVRHRAFADFIHKAVAIGNTLGEEVTVVGLSVGGTFALWASVFEETVPRTIAMAPVAYPRGMAPWLRNTLVRYTAWMPNKFKWWNAKEKDHRVAPPYVYQRYSSKSLGHVLHMNATVEQTLRHKKFPQKSITFVINEADKALDDQQLVRLSNRFATAGMNVRNYIFPAAAQLPHDIIDQHNIKEHKEEVYNIILELIS